MTQARISLGTPYRWLGEALALCRTQPRALFGAACVLLVVALVPSLVQLLIIQVLHPSDSTRLGLQAVFFVVGLLLFPPVVGGFYRVVHALQQGRPATPLQLLAVYSEPPAAIRLILVNLIFVALLIGVGFGLAIAFGGQDLLGYVRELSTLQPGATQLPTAPAGLMPLLAMLVVLGLVLTTAQNLALAHAALREVGPLTAAGDAFKVALRNIGALLLFFLPVMLIGFIILIIVSLVAVLIGAMLSVISPTLVAVLILPLSVLFALGLYAILFAFFYVAWRDTLGGDAAEPDSHREIAA